MNNITSDFEAITYTIYTSNSLINALSYVYVISEIIFPLLLKIGFNVSATFPQNFINPFQKSASFILSDLVIWVMDK